MPAFEYKGLSVAGKNVKGVVEADTIKTARAKLKRDGIYVIDIKDKKAQNAAKKKSGFSLGSGVNIQEMAMMTRQLASLIKAQIPLVDALTAVVDQIDNLTLKSALADVKQMVNEGSSLSKALGKYPKIFSNIYISMAEAGESSGTLDVILLRLAEFTEKQNELKSKVRSAMMYPIIMMGFASLIMVMLLVYVIPKVTKVFEEMEITLPWYTRALINTSYFVIDYWIALTCIVVGSIFIFLRWKSSEAGRPKWDRMRMNLPVVGKINRMVAVSRFAKTLSTLLSGGVPMLNAFDIVKNVVDNKVFERVIAEARDNVSEGESVAVPLKRSGEFPPIVTHMISIGEKTGELEQMLTQISESYDFQVNNSISGMTSILEPLMIIFMGLIVGVIVLSILTPILEMSSSFNG